MINIECECGSGECEKWAEAIFSAIKPASLYPEGIWNMSLFGKICEKEEIRFSFIFVPMCEGWTSQLSYDPFIRKICEGKILRLSYLKCSSNKPNHGHWSLVDTCGRHKSQFNVLSPIEMALCGDRKVSFHLYWFLLISMISNFVSIPRKGWFLAWNTILILTNSSLH